MDERPLREPTPIGVPASTPGDPALGYTPRTFYQKHGKRLFDLGVGGFACLLLTPLFLLLALAIRIESPGPTLYVSTRLGRRARRFRFYKFRSMIRDAEAQRDRFLHLNEMDGPVFKIRDDPRVTRVGRLLRKTSLDELPQLISVLRGDMSLVGPRPPIPAEVERYESWQRRRLSVTPGITCLWQVRGRNRISFQEWMKLDAEYIDTLSFTTDVRILCATIPAVLRGSGAS